MNKLLNKYWEGTTTLQEEEQLKAYFKSDKVQEEHEIYRGLFHSFELEKSLSNESFDAFAKVKSQQSQNHYFQHRTWAGIMAAAGVCALMALGSVYYNYESESDLGTYETPEEAYAATIAALQLVSSKLNQGKENLEPISQIEKQTTQVFKINQL